MVILARPGNVDDENAFGPIRKSPVYRNKMEYEKGKDKDKGSLVSLESNTNPIRVNRSSPTITSMTNLVLRFCIKRRFIVK